MHTSEKTHQWKPYEPWTRRTLHLISDTGPILHLMVIWESLGIILSGRCDSTKPGTDLQRPVRQTMTHVAATSLCSHLAQIVLLKRNVQYFFLPFCVLLGPGRWFFFQVMPMALCVVFVAISGSRVGSGLIKSRGGSRGLLMSLERGVKMVRNSL